MQGKVEISGVNTAKLTVLKSDEMTQLLQRCKQGDEAARQKLIEGNLRLVLSVIQRFSGRGENPDDLFQVGCIGLLKAIENFDPGSCGGSCGMSGPCASAGPSGIRPIRSCSARRRCCGKRAGSRP